jgi:hypothetical protein
LNPPPSSPNTLVNHKQPNSDVTAGYLRLAPDRPREPVQQAEDRWLKLARSSRGEKKATAESGNRHRQSHVM